MTAKKKKKPSDRRLFLQVKGLGVCNPGGRGISIKYEYGKIVSDGVKQISTTIIPIMEEALRICPWKNIGDKMIDLKLLQRYINELVVAEEEADAKEEAARVQPIAGCNCGGDSANQE